MGTTLSDLQPPAGATRNRQRVGRGHGSRGITSGRGQKGQRARSGGPKKPGFEGGQMPLQRRLPKRGFKNLARVAYAPVNVSQLAKAFGAGDVVEASALKEKGLIPRNAGRCKLLAVGDLPHALTIRVQACSAAAREKVVAAGGTVEIVPPVPLRRVRAEA